jgi:hypothetical protein
LASSCTCEPKFYQRLGREVIVLEFAWTAHTDGSFEAVSTDDYSFGTRTLTEIVAGKVIIGVKVMHGTPTPSPGYDIKITDIDEFDIFEGLLESQDVTKKQKEALPTLTVDEGALSFIIEGNSVNSATGTVKLFFT